MKSAWFRKDLEIRFTSDVDAGVRAAAKVLQGSGVGRGSIHSLAFDRGPDWSAIRARGQRITGMIKSALPATSRVSIQFRSPAGSARCETGPTIARHVKVCMLLGAYTDKYYKGYYYFKAQNLRRKLRAGL